MKTVKQIQYDTSKKYGCPPAQFELFISALRDEVINKIKDIRKRVVTYVGDKDGKIIVAYLPDEDRACIRMLTDIFQIKKSDLNGG